MADLRFHDKNQPLTIGEIASLCGCSVVPDNKSEFVIHDVASLDKAVGNDLTFLDNIKYKSDLPNTKASACILAENMLEFAPSHMICLVSKTPYKSYAMAAQLFYPTQLKSASIHPTVIIDHTAVIGENVTIEPYSTIGRGVIIGDNTHIGSNVSISHAVIGQNVRIHNGVRIGQDGFGFAIDANGCVPVPQLGRVMIGNNVNIGANACIDRGSGPDTVIGDGTIIDNLVQIAHNVNIGRGCVIVAQVGISGSTHIDDYCVFGGQSGVAGHLSIGKGVQVGAQSGVTKDIPAGIKVMGFPARPIREFWQEMAKIKKLLSNQ